MTIETNEGQKNVEQEPTPAFVLSWDIELLMESLCAEKVWKLPTAETFDQAKSKLVDALSAAFGETPAIVIEGADIATGVKDAAIALKAVQNSIPIVTMDPIYGATIADYTLNTTRGINADGSIEEISRPGYPKISIQLDALAQALNGARNVCLVDAGAYSGRSIQTIIESMKQRDIAVETVILGIATTEAERALLDYGIRPIIVNNIRTPIDWIEARDFIPFIPLCGRVINEPMPPGKLSRALPYLLPEGNPLDWASVPLGKEIQVSKAGWETSELLFKGLEEQNGVTLKLADLIDLPIRISYPGEIIPTATDVLDIIREKMQMVQYRPYEPVYES